MCGNAKKQQLMTAFDAHCQRELPTATHCDSLFLMLLTRPLGTRGAVPEAPSTLRWPALVPTLPLLLMQQAFFTSAALLLAALAVLPGGGRSLPLDGLHARPADGLDAAWWPLSMREASSAAPLLLLKGRGSGGCAALLLA